MKNPQKNPKKDGKPDGSSAVRYEQQILDTSSIGVLITQISSGTILYANKAIADLLGIAEAVALIGKPVPDFYWDPKDRQALLGRFRAEGSITNSETRARRADGSMIWVSISLQSFNFEGDQVLLSEITDISERKRAEEAQRVSEEQFRSIYDNAAIGLYRTTPDGRILMLNPTGVRLMGYATFDEAAKLNVEKAGYKRDSVRSEFREKVEREGYVIDFENEWKRKDGSSIFVRESAKTIRDENGKVLYYDGSFEDITEQKLAEEALRTERDFNNALVEASPAFLVTIGGDGRIRSMNQSMLQALGYTLDEVEGKDYLTTIVSKDERPALAGVFSHLTDLKESTLNENNVLTKDGRLILVEWHGRPVFKSSGEFDYFFGLGLDITESKQAEDAVKESQQKLSLLIDASPLAMITWNTNFEVVSWNPAAERVFGYSAEEALGKHARFIIPPEYHQFVDQVWQGLITQTGGERATNNNITKDSRTITCEWYNTPLAGPDGKVFGVSSQIEDVTVRRQAEELIHQSESRFRALFDTATDAIFLMQGSTIIDCNQHTAKIYGVERDQVIGKTPLDFSPEVQPDGQNSAEKSSAFINLALAGQPQVFYWKHKRLDGTLFDAEISLNRVDSGGEVYVQAFIRDITERTRLANERERLTSIMESSTDMVALADMEARVIYMNRAGRRMVGIGDDEDITNTHIPDFTPQWALDIVLNKGVPTAIQEGSWSGEGAMLARDGHEIPVSQAIMVHRAADGTPQNLSTVARDITESKRLEEEMRVASMYARNLIEASLDPLVTISPDGKITDVNNATEQITGVSRYILVGKDFADYFTEPDKAREGYQQVFSQGIVKDYPLTLRHVSGRTTEVLYNASVYKNEAGVVQGVFAAARDVTESKRLEREIQEAFERRGYQVQVSTEISQEVASATELSDLFSRVVTLTKERLGYYHTQLLRYDTGQDAVVLINGYGEAGKKMLASGHKMPMGSGLIGTAAESGQTILRSTLAEDPDWQPNPLLPETKGEIAVPIKLGEQVLGVLDVQSDQAGALTEDDRLLLEGLCGQIAVAIEQTRLRQEVAEESQKKYQELFLSSRDGIASISMEGNIMECNAAFETMVGYTQAELQQMQLTDLSPKKWHAMENEILMTQVLPNGYAEPYQKEYIHKDGHIFPVELAIYLTRGTDGNPNGFWGFIRDITERKQAEDELRVASLYARNLIEASLDPLVTISPDGKITDVNNATEQVTGVPRESLIGKEFADYFTEPNRAREGYQQVFSQGTVKDYPLTLRHASGRTTEVLYNASVYKNEAGIVQGVFAAARDVTESKRLEEEARVASLYARNLIEASLDPLVTISPDGKITDVNNATEQVTGVSRQSLIGKEFADYFTEPDKAREGYQQVFSQGSVQDYPLTLRHASGRTTEVLYNASVYKNEAGIVQGVFAAARDVTESKRLEREIQEAFERRGYQVQVSTEISQEVASATELSDLFSRVVTLTKERLGYYHTQLLRYDTGQDAVVLINGYGETGQKMLASGHKLPMGSGLIGTAAESGQTILRATLAEDPDWQPNPLLPETKGEIAVPIKLGEQVLGVLDVQSDQAGALTEDDRLLLEGLCGQVAVAIEGTRLRQEMAERLEEVNRLYRSMSREGWKTYRDTADLPAGFMYDQIGISPVNEDVLADELFAKIPMRVLGGEVVGTLTVANDPRHPTSSEDQVFLQQVSDQIALALESARLFEQTQSALAQTERLSEAGLRFSRAADLQELLAVVNDTLGIPGINRMLLDVFNYNSANEMEGMDIVANWWNGKGHEPSEIGRHYTMENLNVLPLFMSATPVFFNDTFHDERVDGASLELFTRQNIHAMAVLPLYLGARQIGILMLESEEVHNFTQDEIRLFSAMAPQIATVLENRRQFERAQRQAERESTLNIISQKIQGATTVEAVLQIAARELGHALGAPMTIAQLSMKEKKK